MAGQATRVGWAGGQRRLKRCGIWKSNCGVATDKQLHWRRGDNGATTTDGKQQSTTLMRSGRWAMRALMTKTTTQQSTNVRQQRQRTIMAGKRLDVVVEVEEGRVTCIFYMVNSDRYAYLEIMPKIGGNFLDFWGVFWALFQVCVLSWSFSKFLSHHTTKSYLHHNQKSTIW